MSSSSFSSPEISPAIAMGPDIHPDFSYKNATHDEVLEDLSSRFILNLPDEELASLERISFQVEQAHWFYEDFIREQNSKLPSLTLKKFSAMLFKACPLLHHWSNDHEQAFNTFMQYKTRVPVCGAIMLNDSWEKCILVKGWKSSSGWGFPKGKINESEPQATCAVREVLEETGYNLAGQVNPEHVIEMTIKEQRIAMFIVPNVPEDYPFKTKTRKEISKIEWFRLSDLPTWKRNQQSPGKFYLISPFIGPLKTFIAHHRPHNVARKSKRANGRFAAPSIPEADEQFQDASQESSSQTSSADNGGPPTPSPQSTQASQVVHENDDITGMDPHFARLLSSLQSSSSITSTVTKEAMIMNCPVSDTATAETSPEAHPAEVQPSADVQPPIHSTSPSTVRSFNSQSTLTPSYSRLNVPTSAAPSTLPLPIRSSCTHDPTERPGSAFIPTTSPTSSRSIGSRRTSSVADISPYLMKQTPTQTTPSHLKRLMLLESIASESARMTSSLEAREQSQLREEKQMFEQRQFSNGHQAFSGYSVPPPPDHHGLLYSSPSAGGQSFARPLPLPSAPYHDPFQVRPQTSLASHHRSMGMGSNTAQLMHPLHRPPPPLPPQSAMGYGPMSRAPTFGPGSYLPYSSIHAPLPAPGGFGASPYHPPTIPTPNPNANALLSLLNGHTTN